MKTAILKSTPKMICVFCAIAGISMPGMQASAQNLDNLYFAPAPLVSDMQQDARTVPTPVAGRISGAVPGTDPENSFRSNSIAQFLNSVKETEQTEGPWSASLAQQYLSLGNLYRIGGDTDKALEYYGKAEHNSRVNFGLFASEQFLPIRRSIEIYMSLNDYQQALERQEYLVYLHKGHYGREALEVVPELAQLGDMYFDAYERSLRYQSAEKEVQLEYGPDTGFRNKDELTTLERSFRLLGLAQKHYVDTISMLISQEAWYNPLLVPLENNLVATYFLQANKSKLAMDPEFFMSARSSTARDTVKLDAKADILPMYRQGIEAFNRILAYQQNIPGTAPEEITETMLRLGDWHKLFGYSRRADSQYESARHFIVNSSCDPQVKASILAPKVPVQLPAFIARPISLAALDNADESVSFTGYIDIAFTLDDAGNAENIEIMDKSENTSTDVEKRLLKVLRDAPFRPALDEDRKAEKFELRNHFAML